jgi:hypothetical protein
LAGSTVFEENEGQVADSCELRSCGRLAFDSHAT